MVYFSVADVDEVFGAVLVASGREMVGPTAFPGGRFAIVADPQGEVFALHQAGGPAKKGIASTWARIAGMQRNR